MSDSVQPHRWQPTRLPCPWDSPGKNTGVGCHFLLQCMKVKSESEVTQSCPTLGDPMDCSLSGSSVHGIFQARVLEWGAIAFSKMQSSVYQSLSFFAKIKLILKLISGSRSVVSDSLQPHGLYNPDINGIEWESHTHTQILYLTVNSLSIKVSGHFKEKRIIFWTNKAVQQGIHPQRDELRPTLYTTHKN